MIRNSTQYIQTGSKFLRLGSRKIMDYWGSNLQNVEKSARKVYVADDGKVLNQRDQAGAEALIVAYLCRNGNFRKLFLNKIKPHIFVGLHVFKEDFAEKSKHDGLDIHADWDELVNTSIEDLPKNPWWSSVSRLIQSSDDWPPSQRYYYIAKQICHSSNYGIGASRFCMNTLEKSRGKIVLKKIQAQKFLDMYHSLFPEIREWHSQVEQQVRSTRFLYNLLGDPIYFAGDVEREQAVKEMYSSVPQSTVAQITRMAEVKMQEFIELTKVDWDMMQDNHDSLLSQCPDSQEEIKNCHTIMKQYIEPELKSPRGEIFNMRSEGATGYNWAPFKSDNLKGLKAYEI